jgi:hypothetical protein
VSSTKSHELGPIEAYRSCRLPVKCRNTFSRSVNFHPTCRVTLPSRYCDSAKLLNFAWNQFGQITHCATICGQGTLTHFEVWAYQVKSSASLSGPSH